MQTSTAMTEIRKIRDENSQRHRSQTLEEQQQELQESLAWFMDAIGKPVAVIKSQVEGCSTSR
jgi:hypothetical protein